LVDLSDACVAVVALDAVLRRVAVAAVDLDRRVRDAGAGLGGVQLRRRALQAVAYASVLQRCRAESQQARSVELGRHVAELELDGLELRDGLAKRVTLLGVGD